jgi:hypothetical protein
MKKSAIHYTEYIVRSFTIWTLYLSALDTSIEVLGSQVASSYPVFMISFMSSAWLRSACNFEECYFGAALSNAAPVICFSGALRKHI